MDFLFVLAIELQIWGTLIVLFQTFKKINNIKDIVDLYSPKWGIDKEIDKSIEYFTNFFHAFNLKAILSGEYLIVEYNFLRATSIISVLCVFAGFLLQTLTSDFKVILDISYLIYNIISFLLLLVITILFSCLNVFFGFIDLRNKKIASSIYLNINQLELNTSNKDTIINNNKEKYKKYMDKVLYKLIKKKFIQKDLEGPEIFPYKIVDRENFIKKYKI